MMTNAIAKLTTAFEEAFTRPPGAANRDRLSAVLSWPSVPVEIIRAAGMRPVVVRGGTMPTPNADAYLEPGIFPSRLRHLVDAALTGRLSRTARLIIPRTSDPDYKTFLYMREFVRLGIVSGLPQTLLFDLLQSDGPDVRTYDAERLRVLFEELASVTGRQPLPDHVHQEIACANAARAAARRLVMHRQGRPRVTGTEAVPLLGAFWKMPPNDYAKLAGEAADEIARRLPLAGPRVLLAGAPVDGPALHAAIESHSAIVVAEVGPWGSGAAGDDVACDGDPILALADKYRRDAIGARTPVALIRDSMAQILDSGNVEAVVVSLPPDDTTFGWDYPSLRNLLQARHIPHICLCGDPYEPLTPADHERLDTLMDAAVPSGKVGHAK